MQVHLSLNGSTQFHHAVVTIGTFDGVHKGHRRIIEQMKMVAGRIGGETILITFDRHPRDVIQPGNQPVPLLNTTNEKAALLELLGLDHLVVIPFTMDFARMKATDYVERFLIGQFQPDTVIIGYDHRFGADREGDYHLLERYRDQQRFHLEEIPMQIVNDANVSSTRIRQSISEGKVQEAENLLGYPYFFEGTVTRGNQMGRKLGFPTANLEINSRSKLLPLPGVYAVYATIEPGNAVFPVGKEKLYKGMMNLGFRPTVGGDRLVTEVHLLGFEGDIYGKTLRVYLNEFIRLEKKFDGLDALQAQLQADKEAVLQRLTKETLVFNDYLQNTTI